VQEVKLVGSTWQEERLPGPTSQSPHLLRTTVLLGSTMVAHQGVGEWEYVQW